MNKVKKSLITKILLKGKKDLEVTVSTEDLPVLSKYCWGWHTKGVFDHKSKKLITRVLFPEAKKVLYRDRNMLNCTRKNLMPTGSDYPEECERRKAKEVRHKPLSRSKIEGVFIDKNNTKVLIHRKSRGIRFCECVAMDDDNREEVIEYAKKRRRELLKMSHRQLLKWKNKKS